MCVYVCVSEYVKEKIEGKRDKRNLKKGNMREKVLLKRCEREKERERYR